MGDAAVRLERGPVEGGATVLRLHGVLRLADASRLLAELDRELGVAPGPVRLELGALTAIDGGAAALLDDACDRARAAGVSVELAGVREDVRAILDLHGRDEQDAPLHAAPGKEGIFEQVGRSTLELRDLALAQLGYTGDLVVAAGQAVRRPASVHWRDLGKLMERAGADGLPIVMLIGFLSGLILAFQAAVQLKQFGANIFVADLVGLSVTREFGPLMTAIIVAGRTGSAYAAELGTMKVSEEIDALHTLGFDPFRFLVIPRVVALVLMVPLLTLFADFVAVGGGLLVGITGLDLTPSAYLIQTRKAVELWDVFSGVGKSVVFGLSVALIACQRGLATRGGAEGVGRSTTSSVVTILFALVVIDAAFTILFHLFEVGAGG